MVIDSAFFARLKALWLCLTGVSHRSRPKGTSSADLDSSLLESGESSTGCWAKWGSMLLWGKVSHNSSMMSLNLRLIGHFDKRQDESLCGVCLGDCPAKGGCS